LRIIDKDDQLDFFEAVTSNELIMMSQDDFKKLEKGGFKNVEQGICGDQEF
jgi:hypothetical protein